MQRTAATHNEARFPAVSKTWQHMRCIYCIPAKDKSHKSDSKKESSKKESKSKKDKDHKKDDEKLKQKESARLSL